MLLFLGGPIRASYLLTLDFATNPTLPTAQGMGFATDTGSPESTFASIVGGNRLKLDTFQLASDKSAYYFKNNFFDHTIDLEMEVRLKILNSSFFGFSMVAYNANVSSNFVISTSGFQIYQLTSGSGYDFTSSFNTFTYKGYAATNTYEFFVNGTRVAFGARPGGYTGGNQFYFGDGTSTGGNVAAEVQYVRYSNQNFSSVPNGGEVPEPISLATWTLIAGGLMKFRRRRS